MHKRALWLGVRILVTALAEDPELRRRWRECIAGSVLNQIDKVRQHEHLLYLPEKDLEKAVSAGADKFLTKLKDFLEELDEYPNTEESHA